MGGVPTPRFSGTPAEQGTVCAPTIEVGTIAFPPVCCALAGFAFGPGSCWVWNLVQLGTQVWRKLSSVLRPRAGVKAQLQARVFGRDSAWKLAVVPRNKLVRQDGAHGAAPPGARSAHGHRGAVLSLQRLSDQKQSMQGPGPNPGPRGPSHPATLAGWPCRSEPVPDASSYERVLPFAPSCSSLSRPSAS